MRWSLPRGLEGWKPLLERYRTVLLVLAAGMALMLLPTGASEAKKPELPAQSAQEEGFCLEELEQRLSDALSQVEGAGETKVVLTLKGSGRRLLAQDVERSGDRTSTTAVTLGRGGSAQEVVPIQTLAPQLQGALVVCPGGEDPLVRYRIASAVSALTGLGSDRISICKRTS